MSFFVEPAGTTQSGKVIPRSGTALDAVTDPDTLVRSDPSFAERFRAQRDLRAAYDDLQAYTSHSFGNHLAPNRGDFKRVATVPHTVLQAALCVEPDLLVNKKKFYAWLDRHPVYQAYTRRKG